MPTLCLDLGSTTGWAAGPGRPSVSGVWKHKAGRYDGGGMRYLKFRQWLREIQQALGDVDAIYFEEVRSHKGTDAAHVYGGLLAHLTAWCEEQLPPIPYQGIPVGTIKRHATGKGNAGKEQMIVQAARVLGRAPVDDNEADAVCLLCYVQDTMVTKRPRPPRVTT